jgi:hypothetical protein
MRVLDWESSVERFSDNVSFRLSRLQASGIRSSMLKPVTFFLSVAYPLPEPTQTRV